MSLTKRKKFIPNVCSCCKQTTEYALPLDRGTALIVLAIFNRIRDKKQNLVHVGNEMVRPASDFSSYRDMVAGGWMTFKMEGNLSRARFHGLIAMEERGFYLLTKKGARFLRGESVPRVAIIDKTTGHKAYYLEEEKDCVTFGGLLKRETPFWDLSDTQLDRIGEYAPIETSTAPLFAL